MRKRNTRCGLYSASTMSSNVQYATMSPFLHFDITALIIDVVGEDNDTDLLKELALVSHSFHEICSKHLFATVDLHDGNGNYSSSKKGFVKLVKSRPNVVNYIRKLTYEPSRDNNGDHLLAPILSNFLPAISRLNCLAINARCSWDELDSSLTSSFLHLMCLPTINQIDLANIHNFPLSSLTRSVNLHRLDIFDLSFDPPEIVVESEMPKIRELRISNFHSVVVMLHAKMQDGRPAFNFMDLRRLWMRFMEFEDEQNARYLLQNAKLLEKIHFSVEAGRRLVGLHDMLSPIARTLKVLSLSGRLRLAGLCEELEAMAGHYTLEALSIIFYVENYDTEDSIGSNIQKVERVLVRPGWSTLRHVSFKVSCWRLTRSARLSTLEAQLQCLPDKYLNHLSKLDSVSFNYSVSDEYCDPGSLIAFLF